jgi:hypothetical protein
MLNVIVLNVILLNVIVLNVIYGKCHLWEMSFKLSVIMPSVIMLNVVAPKKRAVQLVMLLPRLKILDYCGSG